MMRQAATTLTVDTQGCGLVEVSNEVINWVAKQGMSQGLLTLFIRHTSASLIIQENADPDVQADLLAFFRCLAPEDGKLYRHSEEGPDDMPAHIKAALTNVQLSIPVVNGLPFLGTWQGIYVFEHRHVPHKRSVTMHLLGE